MKDFKSTEMILAKIVEERKKRGIPYLDMSKILGYTSVHGYSGIEYGRTQLSLVNAVKLYQLFGFGFHDVDVTRFTVEKLKSARKEAGFTCTEVAEFLGYKGKSGYFNIESGIRKPRLDIAIKIAELFKVDIEELFFYN